MCNGPEGALGVLLPIPAFLEPYVHFNPDSAEFGIDAEGRRCLAVDECIAPALLALWDRQIPTISACCLHGCGEGVITLPRVHDPHQPPPKANWVLLEEARADLAVSQALAESRSLALATMREALNMAGAGLAGTYAYIKQRGDDRSAADVLEMIDKLDAVLAQPDDDAAALAGAVLRAADVLEEILASTIGEIERETEGDVTMAILHYLRARSALRGDGAAEQQGARGG